MSRKTEIVVESTIHAINALSNQGLSIPRIQGFENSNLIISFIKYVVVFEWRECKGYKGYKLMVIKRHLSAIALGLLEG